MSGLRWTPDQHAAWEARQARQIAPRATIAAPPAPAPQPTPIEAPDGFDSKAERRYAVLLEARRLAGEIRGWGHHRIRLRLAVETGKRRSILVTPDFDVWHLTGAIELVEVKGFIRSDAELRLLTAVKQYPQYLWTIAWKQGSRDFLTQSLPTQYDPPRKQARGRK